MNRQRWALLLSFFLLSMIQSSLTVPVSPTDSASPSKSSLTVPVSPTDSASPSKSSLTVPVSPTDSASRTGPRISLSTFSLSASNSTSLSSSTSVSGTPSLHVSASTVTPTKASISLSVSLMVSLSSLTPSGSGSESLSLSSNVSRTGSLSDTRSHSTSSTTSLSQSVFVSKSSLSLTDSFTENETLSKSLSASIPSLSFSPSSTANESLTVSYSLSLSSSPSESETPTVTLRETTTVPLPWMTDAALQWLRYPSRDAGPNYLLPVQPSLILRLNGPQFHNVPAITGKNEYGVTCEAKILSRFSNYYLSGETQIELKQSICAFSNLRLEYHPNATAIAHGELYNPKAIVTLRVCADVSRTTEPKISAPVCNSTFIRISSCPLQKQEPLFNISYDFSYASSETELLVDVRGGPYPWELRSAVQCILRPRFLEKKEDSAEKEAVAVIVPGHMFDLCNIACPFPLSSYRKLLKLPPYMLKENETTGGECKGDSLVVGYSGSFEPVNTIGGCGGSFSAFLALKIGANELPSTCSALSPALTAGKLNAQRYGRWTPTLFNHLAFTQCETVHIKSQKEKGLVDISAGSHCIVRVLGLPDPRFTVLDPVPFTLRTQGEDVAPVTGGPITAHLCDGSGNSVPYPMFSSPQSSSSPGTEGAKYLYGPPFVRQAAPGGGSSKEKEQNSVLSGATKISPNRTSITFSNITFQSPTLVKWCDMKGQNITFLPMEYFGTQKIPPRSSLPPNQDNSGLTTTHAYCVAVGEGQLDQFVITNEIEILPFADNSSVVATAPIIEAQDSGGRSIAQLASVQKEGEYIMEITVLEANTTTATHSKHKVNISELLADEIVVNEEKVLRTSTFFRVRLKRSFPQEVAGIQFPEPGLGYGLLFEIFRLPLPENSDLYEMENLVNKLLFNLTTTPLSLLNYSRDYWTTTDPMMRPQWVASRVLWGGTNISADTRNGVPFIFESEKYKRRKNDDDSSTLSHEFSYSSSISPIVPETPTLPHPNSVTISHTPSSSLTGDPSRTTPESRTPTSLVKTPTLLLIQSFTDSRSISEPLPRYFYPLNRNITVSSCALPTVSSYGVDYVETSYEEENSFFPSDTFDEGISYRNPPLRLCSEPATPFSKLAFEQNAEEGGWNATEVYRPAIYKNRIRQLAPPAAKSTAPPDGTNFTVVTVHGFRFQYHKRKQIRCHFSSANDPFNRKVQGTSAHFVSSCRILCRIPPQPFPISPSSPLQFNTSGELVNIPVSPHTSASGPGNLRVKFEDNLPWSVPIAIDVVGEAVAVQPIDWTTFLYFKRRRTILDTFRFGGLDIVGNSMEDLDLYRREVTVWSPFQDTLQLNQSSSGKKEMMKFYGRTCSPLSGVAIIQNLTLIEPYPGDYSIIFSSPGLRSYTTLLSIRSPSIDFHHYFILYDKLPLDYTTVSIDSGRSGRLPIQPQVAVIRRNETTTDPKTGLPVADRDVFDTGIIAVVEPLNHSRLSPAEAGVRLSECDPSFGNCASVLQGIASFSSLRFQGIPGEHYRVTIGLPKAHNQSLAVKNVSFVVRVPYCPVYGNADGSLSTNLMTHPNSSLYILPHTVTVKGWIFEAPRVLLGLDSTSDRDDDQYACAINDMILPAKFVDQCTIECFVYDPLTTSPAALTLSSICPADADSSFIGCCYDVAAGFVRCADAAAVTLQLVLHGADFHPVSPFTLIGPPTAALIEPNVQSPLTIFHNHQVVASLDETNLDAFIVSLVDRRGEYIGATENSFTSSGTSYVTVNSVTHILNSNMLDLPASASFLATGGGDSRASLPYTCFPHNYPEYHFDASLDGILAVPVIKGRASFENVIIKAPIAGELQFRMCVHHVTETNNDNETCVFETDFVLHVIPGKPVKACIWNNLTSVTFPRGMLEFQPQPRLLFLDAGGNVYQPIRTDPKLRAYGLLSYDTFVQNLSVVAGFQYRSFDYPTQEGHGTWNAATDNEQMLRSSLPYPEYVEDRGVGLMQYLYKDLKVSGLYGREYRFSFYSPNLYDPGPIFSTPFLLAPCAVSEFGIEGTAKCSTCPRGLDHCLNGANDQCFLCNGSTKLLVAEDYWRSDDFSYFAYYCPSSSCIGRTVSGTCEYGYEKDGPLCAVCINGFAQDFEGKCISCVHDAINIVLVVLIVFAAGIVLAVLVKMSLRSMANENSDPSFIVGCKIFFNFVTILAMLGEFNIQFPVYLLSFFQVSASSTGSSGISVSPVNCLVPEATFLTKLAAQLAMPPVVLCFVGVCLSIFTCIRATRRFFVKKNDKKEKDAKKEIDDNLSPKSKVRSSKEYNYVSHLNEPLLPKDSAPAEVSPEVMDELIFEKQASMTDIFFTTTTVLIFLMYQPIIAQCIKLAKCTKILRSTLPDDSFRILESDPRIDCDSWEYEVYLSVAMYGFLVYAVAIPISAMIGVLLVARHSGWSVATKYFNFLIKGLRLRCWFWEFTILLRKVLIRALIALIEDAVLQALIGIWILTAFFVVQVFVRPFVRPEHNKAEALSLLATVVTLNVGLLMRSLYETTGEVCGRVCQGFAIFLIVFDSCALMALIATIFRALVNRIRENYGVDNAHGARKLYFRMFVRDLKLRRGLPYDQVRPSFRDYTPGFHNQKLAVGVLGEQYYISQTLTQKMVEAGKELQRKGMVASSGTSQSEEIHMIYRVGNQRPESLGTGTELVSFRGKLSAKSTHVVIQPDDEEETRRGEADGMGQENVLGEKHGAMIASYDGTFGMSHELFEACNYSNSNNNAEGENVEMQPLIPARSAPEMQPLRQAPPAPETKKEDELFTAKTRQENENQAAAAAPDALTVAPPTSKQASSPPKAVSWRQFAAAAEGGGSPVALPSSIRSRRRREDSSSSSGSRTSSYSGSSGSGSYSSGSESV